ncbi:DinB family protein [Pedobacter heparinus]|uniref:DinB family protein n=1 Tax=Pedobacter heparinus (strain ATCC 13125 / DSM 2366 / CIP 104194 / JCM 7457 / NBRC 12017 / NCIMB 9290 / NRRL B-14731 / HIM 762-3) TaxID=485917 RepID=C6Y2H1_PEDHD|nr:DinB family protein [Pedobacter heparinus]ACU05181.1 DinB family protein [Pedobacter heparinus DSM 2366]
MTTENNHSETLAITSFAFGTDMLNAWLGHRRLTRRVIEAFPEDKIFDYSIGGMRPFADMVKELLDISGPGIKGIATDEWPEATGFSNHSAKDVAATKAVLLQLWDQATEEIKTYWPKINEARFQENTVVFGMYEGQVFSSILYFIDNEIHHRAQGTVYLRSLGIEPPAFWNRD